MLIPDDISPHRNNSNYIILYILSNSGIAKIRLLRIGNIMRCGQLQDARSGAYFYIAREW